MTNLQTLKAQIADLERTIENKQGEISTAQSNIETFEYECSESDFDEFLDDCHETYNLGGMTFYPSDVLKSCDPIAYRCAKSEYESSFDLDDCNEFTDLKDKLESLENDLEDLENELSDLMDELDSLSENEDAMYSKSESRLNGLYWAETDNGNMLSFKTQDELYAFLNNQ